MKYLKIIFCVMLMCFSVMAVTPPFSALTIDSTGTVQNTNQTITITNGVTFTGPITGGVWNATLFNNTTFSNNIYVTGITTNYTASDGVNVFYYTGTSSGYFTNKIFNIASGMFIYHINNLSIGVPSGAASGWVFTLTNTTTGQGTWSNAPAGGGGGGNVFSNTATTFSTVVSPNFVGNGASLTNLNAAQIGGLATATNISTYSGIPASFVVITNGNGQTNFSTVPTLPASLLSGIIPLGVENPNVPTNVNNTGSGTVTISGNTLNINIPSGGGDSYPYPIIDVPYSIQSSETILLAANASGYSYTTPGHVLTVSQTASNYGPTPTGFTGWKTNVIVAEYGALGTLTNPTNIFVFYMTNGIVIPNWCLMLAGSNTSASATTFFTTNTAFYVGSSTNNGCFILSNSAGTITTPVHLGVSSRVIPTGY